MDLKKKGVNTALIIDDGVDQSPLVSDLGDVDEEWSVFWADLTEQDRSVLDQIYPEYKSIDAEELIQDQAFVTLMFDNRLAFSEPSLNKVFEIYLSNQNQVRRFIDIASKELEDIGFEVSEVGREFEEDAANADLIILDLFLGSAQANRDKKRSIEGLRRVLKDRVRNPPMVLLTSAHHGLPSLRHEFRDDTGLLASGFRTIGKSEINENGRLKQLVFELAEHRDDALKLWTFLHSWEAGITEALKRAHKEIRKLDLEDLSHVKQMLSSEGVPLGGYMVDVMDGVLTHELEADEGVIKAATALNSLEATSFPPNSITGNKNTLEVVRKTLFVHRNRRKLDPEVGFPVSLGDILAVSPAMDGEEAREGTIFEGVERRVFLVLTPACDLIRDPPKAKRLFLLAGVYYDHGAIAYREAVTGAHTPILELSPELRGVVRWDLKHVETLKLETVCDLLRDEGPCYVPARLREHAAIALQQKLLSDLGRVGELKTMPSMFPVECVIYYTNAQRELIPLVTQLDGILVGETSSRLAFDAAHRFAYMREVRSALDTVCTGSKGKLELALEPSVTDALFTKGIKYKIDPKSKSKPCKVPKDDGNQEVEVGKIVFNKTAQEVFPQKSDHQGAGLIFELTEVEPPANP